MGRNCAPRPENIFARRLTIHGSCAMMPLRSSSEAERAAHTRQVPGSSPGFATGGDMALDIVALIFAALICVGVPLLTLWFVLRDWR